MSADDYSLAAIIILLFPMMYFLFASLAFFLRSLGDPIVTWLLRGLFATYFAALIACSALGVVAFLAAGRLGIAAGLGLLAALALGARRWFLGRLDDRIRARDAGDTVAVATMRRLHVGGILYNAVQVAAVLVSIPRIFPAI